MSIKPTDWTFFNHYILFPKDAVDPKIQKNNLIKSIVLGICTLGIIHAACAIVYAAKKLYGRASTKAPAVSIKVNDRIVAEFKQKSGSFNIKNLTEQEIRRMTPDQQGALIDHYAKRKINGPSDLTRDQLRGMIGSETSDIVKIINKQELGLGHCGRYAINNAFQKEILNTEDFLRLTCDCLMEKLSLSRKDAESLINNNDHFGVDVGILEYILKQQLKQPIKYSEIHELPQYELSKQEAMERFIGDAKWAIIANIGDAIYDVPSPTAMYPLTKGHFIALRRDENSKWWYIDSRALKPINIALAVIPSSCTLVVSTDLIGHY